MAVGNREQNRKLTEAEQKRLARFDQHCAELEAQCAAFPQYSVEAPDVRATAAVIAAIVDNNGRNHVYAPSFSLLTKDFFDETSAEVDRVLREALTLHAAGRDASHLGRPRA